MDLQPRLALSLDILGYLGQPVCLRFYSLFTFIVAVVLFNVISASCLDMTICCHFGHSHSDRLTMCSTSVGTEPDQFVIVPQYMISWPPH